MKNIKDIIKETITELKRKNIEVTPNNYFKQFCEISRLFDTNIKECQDFLTLVSTIDDLDKQNIDTPLKLSKYFKKRCNTKKNGLKKLIKSFHEILAPSVNHEINDELKDFIKYLLEKPTRVIQRDSISNLKKLTNKRIANDRTVLKNKTDDIIKITSLMGKYFDKTLPTSSNSTEDIHKIKNELEELNISDASTRELSFLQSKLIESAYTIENSIEKYKAEISHGKEDLKKLENTITKLQQELNSIKEENSLDFLTNVLNRRSFDKEIIKIEQKYTLFQSNYAIVFYDIDYFKKINDTYGHDCGDAVLRTFAGILKGLTRQEDIICRWGGEEFIVLLNYTTENEISKYITRVKNLIYKSEFKYKSNDIKVKFSAGVSYRNRYQNHFDAITQADSYLYQAKNNGRDQVVLEDNIII
ncbi:MAG: GGDEF domain-containing protein [Campylobacterota bacterium]|nr:GGDEF domain-containing protein [Campylobacterota bacterium]